MLFGFIFSDQPKLGLPQQRPATHGTSEPSNGGFLRARFNHNKRKKLRLYQYFQKKALERKNRH